MKKERGKVWLGVGTIVVNMKGEWLVVKKSYGGLKGAWSIPAGFVDAGETLDAAALREIKEETGIDCQIEGVYGIRSGVIHEEISDNMIIFFATLRQEQQEIIIQQSELLDACWIHPNDLAQNPVSSFMLRALASEGNLQELLTCRHNISPDAVFGYTDYKVFI